MNFYFSRIISSPRELVGKSRRRGGTSSSSHVMIPDTLMRYIEHSKTHNSENLFFQNAKLIEANGWESRDAEGDYFSTSHDT
jgi:hypothetical protein